MILRRDFYATVRIWVCGVKDLRCQAFQMFLNTLIIHLSAAPLPRSRGVRLNSKAAALCLTHSVITTFTSTSTSIPRNSSHTLDNRFTASVTKVPLILHFPQPGPHTYGLSTTKNPNSSNMRLLNTKSLQFEQFFDSQIPKYAILSHRWGDDEVTFQEFRKGTKQDGQGYDKVTECCVVADSQGFQWVWIDTCCIDKKSSAELSEAINSMYRWYEGAAECYAYLSDVTWDIEDREASKLAFQASVWFTRGWTLQELLAPPKVMFFDREWKSFGTKKDLSREISAATGISVDHMESQSSACVATKMSWASSRATSRLEDMAYCMLGLFDVNMPLLYGEGNKAFVRLQLEIIRKSDDESVFAWTSSRASHGLLAPWPTCFAQSGDIKIHSSLKKKRFPYLMTNQGLEFEVPCRGPFSGRGKVKWDLSKDRLSLALNCWKEGAKGPLAVTIILARHGTTWQREGCDKLELSKSVRDSVGSKGELKYTIPIHIHQQRL